MNNIYTSPGGDSQEIRSIQLAGPVEAQHGQAGLSGQAPARAIGRQRGIRGSHRALRIGIGIATAVLLTCGAAACGSGAAGGASAGGTAPASSGPTGQAAVLNAMLSSASAPASSPADSAAATPAAATPAAATPAAATPAAATPAAAHCRRAARRLRAEGRLRAARAVVQACRHRLPRLRVLAGIHGQFTFESKTGPRTIAFERGAVESVSGSAIVIRAQDGTTWTWALVGHTVVRENGHRAAESALSAGEHVFVGGPVTGGAMDARLIVIRASTSASGSS